MEKKPDNKIKWLIAIFLLIWLVVFNLSLFDQSLVLGLFLLIGVGLGYVESRSEIGIASGYINFFITGRRTRLYGLLLLFGLGALGALGVHFQAAQNGALPAFQATSNEAVIPGTTAVSPVNFGLVLGGFLFGVGMTINQGCGLGTLRNTGQGHFRYVWTLLFLLIGTIPGQFVKYQLDQSVLHEYSLQVYLPSVFGYTGTILRTIIVLLLLAYMAAKYEKMRKQNQTFIETVSHLFPKIKGNKKSLLREASLDFQTLFKKQWPRIISVVVMTGLFVLALILTGQHLAVTKPLINPAIALFQSLGFSFDHEAFSQPMSVVQNGLLQDSNTLQNLGIIVGGTLYALTSTNFTFSFSMNWREAGWYMLSGFLMGFGAVLASGCIVGALYSGIVNFSLSGWVVFASMNLGIILTVKLLNGRVSTVTKK